MTASQNVWVDKFFARALLFTFPHFKHSHQLNTKKTPSELGYRMPAEWTSHYGTLLSWPVNRETWPDELLERVEKVYCEIIGHVVEAEQLHLIVNDEKVKNRVVAKLMSFGVDTERIIFHLHTSNDVWARDFGPIFVRNEATGEVAITNWGYNAWGGKYPPFDSDDAVPALIAGELSIDMFTPGMILEGGSIETNGKGVMLTTESVLLNPNRNPDMSKDEIEERMMIYLGQEKIIWLKNGLAGDDTDGHIDDLSRFLDERTIMTMVTDDENDVNYKTLQENLEILKNATDAEGNPFNIVTLPMPETKIEGTTVDGSEHVPASYANFYFINGAVLLPVYDERYDQQAIDLFSKHLPFHKIIPVPCADLVWGQGSIHCISQQLYK